MSGICDTCGDDRFELIATARAKLLDATNIESRPEEVAILDSILFRCWQMGWLDSLRENNNRYFELFGTPERAARTLAGICESCKYGDCVTCGVPEWASYLHDYDALLEWLRGDAE